MPKAEDYRVSIVTEYLEKNPKMPTKTLARLIFNNHPIDFPTLNTAYSMVRYRRNEHGFKAKPKTIIAERTMAEKKQAHAWNKLPETDYKECEPFVLPKGNNRILVLSDIHLPYHDVQALSIALQWGYEHKPNAIILNGDTMDMYQASRYVKDRRLRDLNGEIEMTRDFLRQLRDEFDCPVYFKIGNHCDRWENYLKTVAPELLGIADFELKNILRFGELGVTEIKSRQIIKAGKLNILHGHEFGHSVFSPVNPARGLYMRSKANSLIGHHHQTSEHSENNLEGDVVTTWSVGCLCGLRPEYMPYNKWNHGFAFITTEPNGDFNVQNLRIIKGEVR